MKKQNELDLKIVPVGKPSIATLSESERRVFFETILNRIKKLAAEEKKWKIEGNNHAEKP